MTFTDTLAFNAVTEEALRKGGTLMMENPDGWNEKPRDQNAIQRVGEGHTRTRDEGPHENTASHAHRLCHTYLLQAKPLKHARQLPSDTKGHCKVP